MDSKVFDKINFKEKYIKYKKKYLELKKSKGMTGGNYRHDIWIENNFFEDNKFSKILDRRIFRKNLFLGMTPPHQTTLFSKSAFEKLPIFSDDFLLASDLNYFLNFSKIEDISILVLNDELVNMSTGGISGQKNKLRLKEVICSYKQSFGIFFPIPFIFRYLRKISLKFFRIL